MAELDIVQYGNPILRKKGKRVKQFDDALRQLVQDMIQTMHTAEGIGLAAQQVDLPLQLCVVDLRDSDRDFEFELDGGTPPLDLIMPLVLINPVLKAVPKPVTTYAEGCLSFPGIQGDIDRPDRIDVRFSGPEGGLHNLTCNGLFSRCIQHEVDHLNGVLFIDRMHRTSLLEVQQEIKQLKKTTRKRLGKATRAMRKADGMNYAPEGRPEPVVKPGEFVFAAAHLDHGHIFGQCNGLIDAGGTLKWVFDPDEAKVAAFREKFPQVQVASSLESILDDTDTHMVAAAAVPCDRGPLGCRIMQAGKDYFTDKTPFTELDQLDLARRVATETGRRYMVYFSERLHVESAMFAGDLVRDGTIGRVVQVLGLGPHRLSKLSRPDWFFQHKQYGGILCDIGSHQIEQFLFYAGAADASVTNAAVGNFNNHDTPELEDFGEASLVADNGASNYFRVDWFTPDGLGTWGDGRTIILGTDGYIEMRKYINVATAPDGDHLFLVTGDGEQHLELAGKVGYPFFGQLILDSLNRTENAMTQAHAFKAAELCLKAQLAAKRIA